MSRPDTRCLPRLLTLAAAVALVASACSPPPDPPSDTVDDGWSVDTHGGSDTAEEPGDGGEDGGPPADLALDLGSFADEGNAYDPYPEEGAEIRLVHGFQGGYHVEPSMYLSGISQSGFEATITYEVERVSDGEKLNRRDTYIVGQYGWTSYKEGFLHHSNPVVFKTRTPDEVLGDEIQLRVTVDLENGGKASDTQTGTLIDAGRP